MSNPYKKNSIHNFDTFPPLLQQFLNYNGAVKNNSQNTIQAYAYDLNNFLKYTVFINYEGLYGNYEEVNISEINENFLSNITEEDIFEYLYFCKCTRNVGANARTRCLVAIREFFEYLYVHKKVISNNPTHNIDSPKIPKKVPKYLTFEQSVKLLNSLDTKSKFYERDYCILSIFLNCGLRVSELVGIDLNSIRDDRTLIVTGKGNKQRVVHINDACYIAIEMYLKVRSNLKKEIVDKDALFISSQSGKRMTVRRVQQIVEDALEKAGLSGLGFSPHKLRHTAATLMYQNGVDVRTLKDVLGHEQLNTTQIYTHVNKQQMEDAANTNPLSKVMPKFVK